MEAGKRCEPALLDDLAEKCGCEYLSDLHYVRTEEICDKLTEISEEAFAEKEWKDAYEYLSGKHSEQGTKVSKEMLLNKLSKKEKE